jgi:hypothetical protein
MSLVVTVFVPEGIIMAGDSRLTLAYQEHKKEGEKPRTVEHQVVLSDNAYKVEALEKANVGVGTFGSSIIDNMPVMRYIWRFERTEVSEGESVADVANKLVSYFRNQFPGVDVGFHVCGYRREKEGSIPYVYFCHTTKEAEPKRWNADEQGEVKFGVIRSGDTHVVDRLIDTKSLPVFSAMPLQDAIDYAVYLITTTIETLRFEPKFPSVGGPIDVLVITPRGMRFVQRKELHGIEE